MNIFEHDQPTVELLKGDPSELKLYKQTAYEVKAVADEDLVLQFTISDSSVDRSYDTVDVNGWKTDHYMKNPVVLFGHDYRSLPVATATSVWKRAGLLKSKAKFTPEDVYPFGYSVYRLCKEGFLKAASVGFRPLKWEPAEDEERRKRGGVDFLAQELLEWSVVPVPANASALLDAKAKGINVLPIKEWAVEVLDTWDEERGLLIPRKEVEQVYATLKDSSIAVPANIAEGKAGLYTEDEDNKEKNLDTDEDEATNQVPDIEKAEVSEDEMAGKSVPMTIEIKFDDPAIQAIKTMGALLEEVSMKLDLLLPAEEKDVESYFELAEDAPQVEPQTNLDFDVDTLKELVRSAVAESMYGITGKLD